MQGMVTDLSFFVILDSGCPLMEQGSVLDFYELMK
jgi:hypothetical protein